MVQPPFKVPTFLITLVVVVSSPCCTMEQEDTQSTPESGECRSFGATSFTLRLTQAHIESTRRQSCDENACIASTSCDTGRVLDLSSEYNQRPKLNHSTAAAAVIKSGITTSFFTSRAWKIEILKDMAMGPSSKTKTCGVIRGKCSNCARVPTCGILPNVPCLVLHEHVSVVPCQPAATMAAQVAPVQNNAPCFMWCDDAIFARACL